MQSGGVIRSNGWSDSKLASICLPLCDLQSCCLRLASSLRGWKEVTALSWELDKMTQVNLALHTLPVNLSFLPERVFCHCPYKHSHFPSGYHRKWHENIHLGFNHQNCKTSWPVPSHELVLKQVELYRIHRYSFPQASSDFPVGASGKEHVCQSRSYKRCGFNPWGGKIPWRRAWQPTPVFLPGESPWTEETVHVVAKSWIWVKQLSMHVCKAPTTWVGDAGVPHTWCFPREALQTVLVSQSF